MKGRLLVLLVLLLSACSLALSFTVWKTEKKPVQKGCVDLREIDLQNGQAVDLRGEWEFFENKFIVTELLEDPVPDGLVSVPSYHRSTGFGQVFWGSYRVTLKNCLPELTVAVSLRGMPSAYRIFINGQSVGMSGTVSSNASVLSVDASVSEESYVTLQAEECELVVETAGRFLPGLSVVPRIQEKSAWREAYDQYRAFVLLLFGMHILFAGAYMLQLILIPRGGYSWVMFGALALLGVRGMYTDSSLFALLGQGTGYDLQFLLVCAGWILVWEILLRLRYGYTDRKKEHKAEVTEVMLFGGLAAMAFAAAKGFAAWWLYADLAAGAILVWRLGCLAKRKENTELEIFAEELGLILFWGGCMFSDLWAAGRCPYYGKIIFFLGVICFDLAVNIIDRYRMNKIQAKALEVVQIESELQQARLELALHQIKPHFLQNALMSIKVLCRTRPKEAEQAVYDFAVFLRSNMNALESTEPIPFSEELKTIRGYLHIEQIRFGSRLCIVWDIQEEDFRIPPLTIQPLVENAVRHGICQKMEGGTVTIASRRSRDEILVEIRDDGVGFDASETEAVEGIGIRNLRLRLKNLLHATLEMKSRPGEGCIQTVHIPLTNEGGEKFENYHRG